VTYLSLGRDTEIRNDDLRKVGFLSLSRQTAEYYHNYATITAFGILLDSLFTSLSSIDAILTVDTDRRNINHEIFYVAVQTFVSTMFGLTHFYNFVP